MCLIFAFCLFSIKPDSFSPLRPRMRDESLVAFGHHESICQCPEYMHDIICSSCGGSHRVGNCYFLKFHQEIIDDNNNNNNNKSRQKGFRCIMHEHQHGVVEKIGTDAELSASEKCLVYGSDGSFHQTTYVCCRDTNAHRMCGGRRPHTMIFRNFLLLIIACFFFLFFFFDHLVFANFFSVVIVVDFVTFTM